LELLEQVVFRELLERPELVEFKVFRVQQAFKVILEPLVLAVSREILAPQVLPV
jgi:hypothetical protein